MRRVVALAAVALLISSGCAKSSNNVIVFWQFSPIAAIQPVLERFEAQHPGVKVQVEQLTWQSGREKIVAAIAAGRPPDLCELGSTFLPGLVADSTLIDLTDRVSDLRADLVGWNVSSYKGRVYGIPWMLGTRALFVNDNLVNEAKMSAGEPILTWGDLRAKVQAISERCPGARGFGMNAGEREILFKKFMPFAWGNGGDIL
ncbi:MAG TPA: extracellular solute-binding protein, partial [Candidatus Eisenbacteria bacterium]|nr:extracellular solute-binding protein [Candidatus Eisenbacteria bacterium]